VRQSYKTFFLWAILILLFLVGAVIWALQGARFRAGFCLALAAAIEKWSAKQLVALGRDAAGRVQERYAWPQVFAQLFCIYRQVCAKYRRS